MKIVVLAMLVFVGLGCGLGEGDVRRIAQEEMARVEQEQPSVPLPSTSLTASVAEGWIVSAQADRELAQRLESLWAAFLQLLLFLEEDAAYLYAGKMSVSHLIEEIRATGSP